VSPHANIETIQGARGDLALYEWPSQDPHHIVILAHGYAEHLGRYDHVAEFLTARGAVVAGPDHWGHGRSGGDRVLIDDYEPVVADLHTVVGAVRARHAGLPLVLIGHSMGGMIGARYAQLHRDELAGLVLSDPVLGTWSGVTGMLALDEIPDVRFDATLLSRDPRVAEEFDADELVWHGPFKRETIAAFDTELKTISAGPALTGLPTLWMHGGDDQAVPQAETRRGIEALGFDRLQSIVYDGARHEPFNETNRDEVLGGTADFIDAVTGG
jgi:alpha-beta hydrolase superfamily lysophospholipase